MTAGAAGSQPRAALVADDEHAMRLLIRFALTNAGWQVIEAADGQQAWQLLQQHRPSVALLDVQMPGRTGLDLTRAVRADPDLASMPIVLISAQAQAQDIDAGYAAGADHYVTKPFSIANLLALLDHLVPP